MEENKENDWKQIVDEFKQKVLECKNELSDEYKLEIIDLLIEIKNYRKTFYKRIVAFELENDNEGILLKKEIQRGETIFDRVNESLLRIDIIFIKLIKMIEENQIDKLQDIIEKMKTQIREERKELIEINNEILKILKKLEKKRFKREM